MAGHEAFAAGTLLAIALAVSACPRPEQDDTRPRPASAAATSATVPSASQTAISSELRSRIQVPTGATGRVPFVLWLHGLGSSGEQMTRGLGVATLAAERHFAYAVPNGALDSKGRRFWNASPACCNFDHANVDHVAELGALIRAAREHPAVDPARIYVVGFSNGGFMAHRLACEVPGITAIASLAGAGPSGPCAPPAPVAVLQVHADLDPSVRYDGGRVLDSEGLEPHPSARDTVRGWAQRDGCQGEPRNPGTLDLDEALTGSETVISAYSGCQQPVELWTVRGGNHFVASSHQGLAMVLAFLEKQAKR